MCANEWGVRFEKAETAINVTNAEEEKPFEENVIIDLKRLSVLCFCTNFNINSRIQHCIRSSDMERRLCAYLPSN